MGAAPHINAALRMRSQRKTLGAVASTEALLLGGRSDLDVAASMQCCSCRSASSRSLNRQPTAAGW